MTNHTRKADVNAAPWVLNLIKQHALHHSQEIYGWLIGRETASGGLYVCSAMPCEHYQEQSQIGAAPDPRDIQDIGNALPNGLGIIGIYHSHPAEIFHSSVDNQTLLNLSRFYPHMLSAVTNADHFPDPLQNSTKWFQMDIDGKKILEITIGHSIFPPSQVSTVVCKGSFDFDVELPCEGNLGVNLLRILLDLFEHRWVDAYFSVSRIKETNNFSNALKLEGTDHQFSVSNLSSSKKLSKWLRRGDLLIKGSFPDKLSAKPSIKSDSSSFNPKSPMIQISGQIPLLTIVSVDVSAKRSTLEPIVEQIKTELLDDLILKVTRGCFSSIPTHPSGSVSVMIITPETSLLGYPGVKPGITIPLYLSNLESLAAEHERIWQILSTLMPSFPRANFPRLSQVITLENQTLDNFVQRAIVLGYSDQKLAAQNLLEDLKKMHMQRGNITQTALLTENIHTLMFSDPHKDLKNDQSNSI